MPRSRKSRMPEALVTRCGKKLMLKHRLALRLTHGLSRKYEQVPVFQDALRATGSVKGAIYWLERRKAKIEKRLYDIWVPFTLPHDARLANKAEQRKLNKEKKLIEDTLETIDKVKRWPKTASAETIK